jgi:hypothetical protein
MSGDIVPAPIKANQRWSENPLEPFSPKWVNGMDSDLLLNDSPITDSAQRRGPVARQSLAPPSGSGGEGFATLALSVGVCRHGELGGMTVSVRRTPNNAFGEESGNQDHDGRDQQGSRKRDGVLNEDATK